MKIDLKQPQPDKYDMFQVGNVISNDDESAFLVVADYKNNKFCLVDLSDGTTYSKLYDSLPVLVDDCCSSYSRLVVNPVLKPASNGCKYCKNKYKIGNILFPRVTFDLSNQKICIEDNDHNKSYLTDIKFCPYCGRDLRAEGEDE